MSSAQTRIASSDSEYGSVLTQRDLSLLILLFFQLDSGSHFVPSRSFFRLGQLADKSRNSRVFGRRSISSNAASRPRVVGFDASIQIHTTGTDTHIVRHLLGQFRARRRCRGNSMLRRCHTPHLHGQHAVRHTVVPILQKFAQSQRAVVNTQKTKYLRKKCSHTLKQ